MTSAAPATKEDLELFGSLRRGSCPPGRFIGDGIKIVRRVLESGLTVERLLMTERWHEELRETIGSRPGDAPEVRIAEPEALNEIVGFRLHQSVMVMAVIPPSTTVDIVLAGKPDPLFLALDGVSNSENVGAIVRTAAAFGVDGLIVGETSCSPWMRRAVRNSMGGIFRVPVIETENLAGLLGRHPPIVSYAAHIHGDHAAITEVDYRGPVCIVVGGEAEGVSPAVLAVCRKTIFIPMAAGWDCLNVGAATSVLLYEAGRSRGFP